MLHEAGYDFEVHPADIDEDDHPENLLPGDLAEWLATQKAMTISQRFPASVILAADTAVAFGDAILGKPDHADHAREMLRLLGGSTHMVVTGIAVKHPGGGGLHSTRVISAVNMRALTPEEIETYLVTGDWQGKAGGYGIQDPDPFVTRIQGSYTNIVGLPMEEARALLSDAGINPRLPHST